MFITKSKKNLEIFFYLLVFICFLLLAFKFYAGNHHSVYLHIWQHKLGIADFEFDYFVQNNNHTKLSVLYDLFGYLKINLDNDYIGFFIYLIFVSISFIFSYKILRNNFKLDRTVILIILFSLIFTSDLIIQANKVTWVTSHTATPTFFVHSLIPMFIWSLINKKIKILFFLSIFMLLSSIKTCWFLIGVGIMFSLIKFEKKDLVWLIGPVLGLSYLILVSLDLNFDNNNRELFFDTVIKRDLEEAAFHLQKVTNLFFLIISFILYFFLMKSFKNDFLGSFLKILFWLSLINFIFFYFYALYGKNIYPEPRLLALSGTRALGVYEYFFWILISVFIIKMNILNFYKIILFSLIFYYSTKSLLAIILFSILASCILIVFKYIQSKRLSRIFNLSEKGETISTTKGLIFFIILVPGITYLMWSKVINTFDLYGLKTINKWTTGSLINDRERLQNAIKLKKCEDFLLLDIDHFFITSSISGKSNFMGNLLFNHFHKELIEENDKRSKLVLNIKNNIENENFIDNEIIEILYLKETVLITKNKNVKFFKNIEILPISNNESLVIFFKKRNSNYLKRCLEI